MDILSKVMQVDQHHQVLLPWCRWRRRSARPAQVLTLDHHTDVLPAFGDRPNAGYDYRSDEAVTRAIGALRHDEHLDWAVTAGVIARATVISQEDFTLPARPELRVVCDPGWPPPQEFLAASERAREMAAGMLESEFLARQLGSAPLDDELPLILDVDLDCFPSQASLSPRDPSLLRRLARQAVLITVSREREWQNILRFPEESLTPETTLTRFLELLR